MTSRDRQLLCRIIKREMNPVKRTWIKIVYQTQKLLTVCFMLKRGTNK